MAMNKEILDELVNKTASDPDLRQQMLADPRATLTEHDIEISEDIEMVVLESSRDVLHLPLFPFVGDQLSEEQLQSVSGGLQRMTMAQLAQTLFNGATEGAPNTMLTGVQRQIY